MSVEGQGRLTLELADDYPGGTPDTYLRGLYHYRTRDFGGTWSEPEYEANRLSAASSGPVPELTWHPAVPLQEAWASFLRTTPERLATAPE